MIAILAAPISASIIQHFAGALVREVVCMGLVPMRHALKDKAVLHPDMHAG